MSDTMRERLIRILGESYDGDADPDATPNNWRRAESALDAILAEMREPDDDMTIAVGRLAMTLDRSPTIAEAHAAMIDALRAS